MNRPLFFPARTSGSIPLASALAAEDSDEDEKEKKVGRSENGGRD